MHIVRGACHPHDKHHAHCLVEVGALLHLHLGPTVQSEDADPDPVDVAPSQEAIEAEGDDRSGSERMGTSAWQGGGAMMCVVHDTCYCGGSNL